MSYTYLLEQGEESSAECFSDIPQSVLLNLNLTAEKSCSKDNETESYPSSQSGMMLKPSTGDRGEEKLTSSVEGSRVRTSARQEREPVSTVNDQECGEKCKELSVKFDLKSSSWKTHLYLWEEDLLESSVILPRWGMMQSGVCWELTMPELHTKESESGSWPTPRCQMARRPNWERVETGNHKCNLEDYTAIKEGLTRGSGKWSLNPEWCEWLMGWPVGWTNATEPLGMDKFRSWLRQHGEYLEENK